MIEIDLSHIFFAYGLGNYGKPLRVARLLEQGGTGSDGTADQVIGTGIDTGTTDTGTTGTDTCTRKGRMSAGLLVGDRNEAPLHDHTNEIADDNDEDDDDESWRPDDQSNDESDDKNNEGDHGSNNDVTVEDEDDTNIGTSGSDDNTAPMVDNESEYEEHYDVIEDQPTLVYDDNENITDMEEDNVNGTPAGMDALYGPRQHEYGLREQNLGPTATYTLSSSKLY
jgi:hypothetical protein